MGTTAQYPANASIYEIIRTRPGARARLLELGLTREHFDFPLGEAARALGIPVERLAEAVAADPE